MRLDDGVRDYATAEEARDDGLPRGAGYAPLYTLLITFLACYPLWGCAVVGFGTVASTVRRSPSGGWYVPAPGDLEKARARYPVSVVIPAHDEESTVAHSIDAPWRSAGPRST